MLLHELANLLERVFGRVLLVLAHAAQHGEREPFAREEHGPSPTPTDTSTACSTRPKANPVA